MRPGSTAPSAGATSTAASDSADGSGSAPADGSGSAPADGSGSAPADGSGSAPADGSVSIATMGAPTSTVVPASWKIRVTTPAHFAGISTAAFAVSTSTIGWF